eukprot:COSAG01_NODE_3532_length_5963_cov_21.070771_9_plen_34_part_00
MHTHAISSQLVSSELRATQMRHSGAKRPEEEEQ